MDEISEYIPEENQKKVKKLIKNEFNTFIPSGFLKKDAVNIIDVNTGMMPRIPAEKYLRNVAKAMSKKTKGYEVFYVPRNAEMPATVVSQIDKGKLGVINIYTGNMSLQDAEKHLGKHRELCKNLKDRGYDVLFAARAHETPATTIQEYDD